MAFATALTSLARQAAAACAVLVLAGCVGNSTFDQLNAATPIGSGFDIALFKDYSYLARSFGTQADPGGQAFDAADSISLTATDNTVEGLANTYAQKALTLAKGDEVLPEVAADSDVDAENVRLELLRDLDQGRDKAPEDAARAQADYDCWLLDRRIPSLAEAAATCRRSVTASLARLERDLNPATATPAPAPMAAPQPAAFDIEFGFQSAKIPADQQATIAQIIAAARAGKQSHITVVGHADTAEKSIPLSEKRADAVKAALVQLGAREAAIAASGAGTDDPAVQTDDNVKEPKNRRVVITLVP
jgi:OOP family OmpA-OmpF porin